MLKKEFTDFVINLLIIQFANDQDINCQRASGQLMFRFKSQMIVLQFKLNSSKEAGVPLNCMIVWHQYIIPSKIIIQFLS